MLTLAQSQYIYRLPESMVGSNAAYLDILPNDEGYNHIALFSPADSSIPKWLTSGPWEVTSGVLGVDVDKAVVYVWTPRRSEVSFLTNSSVTSLQRLLLRLNATCTRPLFQASQNQPWNRANQRPSPIPRKCPTILRASLHRAGSTYLATRVQTSRISKSSKSTTKVCLFLPLSA